MVFLGNYVFEKYRLFYTSNSGRFLYTEVVLTTFFRVILYMRSGTFS